MKTDEKIAQQLAENPVMIYMKGTPEKPECGFSAKAVSYLNKTSVPYSYLNVLQAPFIYERLPEYSNFPTFPQIFINGDLIGGSDIVEQMYQSGELLTLLQQTSMKN